MASEAVTELRYLDLKINVSSKFKFMVNCVFKATLLKLVLCSHSQDLIKKLLF